MLDVKMFRGNVLVATDQSSWAGTAKADKRGVETDANKNWLGITKQLFDRKNKEYVKLREEQRAIKKWVKQNSVPSYFKRGIVLVKTSLLDSLAEKVTVHNERVERLASSFANVLPGLVVEAQKQLKSQFRWTDYTGVYADYGASPPEDPVIDLEDRKDIPVGAVALRLKPQFVVRRFKFGYQTIQITVPEGLPPEMRAAEETKLKERFEECERMVTAALYEGLRKVVDEVVDKLKPEEDGKKKRFAGGMFTAFIEFCDSIKNRNVMGDDKIVELTEQARAILANVAGPGDVQSPEAAKRLKNYTFLRNETKAKFSELSENIVGEIKKLPTRRFEFEEEETEEVEA